MREKSLYPAGFWEECYKCKTQMWLPAELRESAIRAKSAISFYCAYGHRQGYIEGETEEVKLRRERDRLQQKLAEKDDAIRHEREVRQATERQLSAQKAVATKLRNRAAAGVCPCCNRTFLALQRHMDDKHPTFKAEEVAA